MSELAAFLLVPSATWMTFVGYWLRRREWSQVHGAPRDSGSPAPTAEQK